MKADKIGLYVHIPFCKSKCKYCDFCSFTDADKESYLDALIRDIDSYKGCQIEVNSVFFGGGTPSLLSGEQMEKLFFHLRNSFDVSCDSEITLEANPKTLTSENLEAYIRSGINRISLGLQSIHENELKKLGRIHNFSEFLETYNMVRNNGVNNLNVDLMYGIPEQTKESFEKTLSEIIKLSPEHISVYGLILEEGTPLYAHSQQLSLPTEDEECDMYYLASKMLSDNGYTHYEVSNYCKDGHACRHNLKYWRDEEYIGVGLSAYSYFGRKRFGKTRDMSLYLNDPLFNTDIQTIDLENEKYEYVMMRTRLSEGFSLEEYKERFSEDFLATRRDKVEKFVDLGYIGISEDRLFFTDKGMYVGNSLLTELI